MLFNYKNILIENFNTTNQTQPLCLPHDNFVTDIQLPTCGMVQTLSVDKRCAYVRETEQCSDDVFIFDYVEFFFCSIDSNNIYMVGCTLFSFMCVIATLFIILGRTADGFFCPSLKVLSSVMGLNENVAGVTLLAFGNCAPDFITNITGLSTESRRLYSDTFGGAFFVIFAVSGIIILFVPFEAQPTNFLRDSLFLILSLVYIDYAFRNDDAVNLQEGITILAIYIFYIVAVVLDQYFIVRTVQAMRSLESTSVYSTDFYQRLSKAVDFEVISRNSRYSRYTRNSTNSRNSRNSRNSNNNPDLSSNLPDDQNPNKHLFSQLLMSINPIDIEEWEESGIISKLFMIIKTPMELCLKCLIPVVDYDLDDHGWSKLLNCIQNVTLPMFVVFATLGEITVYDIPLWALTAVVMLPLSVLMFVKSRTDRTPSFHKYCALTTSVGSVYVIYACAAETISVLNILGLVLHRSNSFLGCTLLAWGNSIGDLVSNLSLARSGYQEMSFAACFGGPLFNILVGIGMGMTYKAATSEDYKTEVSEGTMGENTKIFMAFGLLGFMFGASTTNFILRRSLGIYLLLIYAIYFIMTLLGELEIIHTYGSDHRMDMRIEPIDI